MTTYHDMLLRIAGWAPDDLVAAARVSLAHGRPDDVADMVARAAVAGQCRLADADIDLLEATGVVAAGHLTRGRAELPPVALSPGSAEPDAADLALVAAADIESDGTARAVWRSWRAPWPTTPWPPPVRVVLVHVRATDRMPLIAARLAEVLEDAGVPQPQVEVFADADTLPRYQRTALAAATLLWTADETTQPIPVLPAPGTAGAAPGTAAIPGSPVVAETVADALLLHAPSAAGPALRAATRAVAAAHAELTVVCAPEAVADGAAFARIAAAGAPASPVRVVLLRPPPRDVAEDVRWLAETLGVPVTAATGQVLVAADGSCAAPGWYTWDPRTGGRDEPPWSPPAPFPPPPARVPGDVTVLPVPSGLWLLASDATPSGVVPTLPRDTRMTIYVGGHGRPLPVEDVAAVIAGCPGAVVVVLPGGIDGPASALPADIRFAEVDQAGWRLVPTAPPPDPTAAPAPTTDPATDPAGAPAADPAADPAAPVRVAPARGAWWRRRATSTLPPPDAAMLDSVAAALGARCHRDPATVTAYLRGDLTDPAVDAALAVLPVVVGPVYTSAAGYTIGQRLSADGLHCARLRGDDQDVVIYSGTARRLDVGATAVALFPAGTRFEVLDSGALADRGRPS